MNITALVTRYFDRYSIVARLFPALLFILPILVSALVIFPALLSRYRNLGFLGLAVVGALYLIGSFARSRGKIVESKLLKKWGGFPSTIILRHRDITIDPKTKARYHQALEKMVGEALPSQADEAADPTEADNTYRSATKLLIEKRRGKQYPRVHEENAHYGFLRNMLGLRVPAILVATFCAAVTVLVWLAANPVMEPQAIRSSVLLHSAMPVLVGADLIYALLIFFCVNERFVRQAANSYALALFRTLEPTTARRMPAGTGKVRLTGAGAITNDPAP